VFDQIAARDDSDFLVVASYMEIYNEKVRDSAREGERLRTRRQRLRTRR
jgi:hypothetical protein